jgi:hypothetical protein
MNLYKLNLHRKIMGANNLLKLAMLVRIVLFIEAELHYR